MRRGGDQGEGKGLAPIPRSHWPPPLPLCFHTAATSFFFLPTPPPPQPKFVLHIWGRTTGTAHVHARVNVHSGPSPRAHWGLAGQASALSDATGLPAGEEDWGGSRELRDDRPGRANVSTFGMGVIVERIRLALAAEAWRRLTGGPVFQPPRWNEAMLFHSWLKSVRVSVSSLLRFRCALRSCWEE